MIRISGKDNKTIKEINKIRKNSSKLAADKVFIEGEKIIRQALDAGVIFDWLILSDNMSDKVDKILLKNSNEIFVLSDQIFKKISYSKTPQGIAAVVKSPILHSDKYLEKIKLSNKKNVKFLLCQDIQDPGNFGNIIRTCDAFAIDGVIFTNNNVNPFNEKVIRATMGSIFNVPLIFSNNLVDTLKTFKSINFTIYGLDLTGASISKDTKFEEKSMFILGNEGNGIYSEILSMCDHIIKIPMKGKAESLNVSSAASIIAHLISDWI